VTASDLVASLTPVVRTLESLRVPYYIGGSVASSVHGVPRASVDADVIADLHPHHVAAFVAALRDAFYVDEGRVRAAVETRRSFNLIHLATAFKVDVFAAKSRPFDREALRRAQPEPLEETPAAPAFRVASAEDTVLAKLEWFRAGGEVSDRQWADIAGILKAGAARLDHAYLQRWAAALTIADLLERALREAEG
jgi:hypothetical protein